MPLRDSGVVALVHKEFNASNANGQFNFGSFLADDTIRRFTDAINHGDVRPKIGKLYNGLFDLHQTKRKVPVGSFAKTRTDFGIGGDLLEVVLIRRNANESAGDDEGVVGPLTITLKRISAVIAHTVLTYIDGRAQAGDHSVYKTLTGEDKNPRVINALFDKYYQLPPFSSENGANLIQIAKVYLGYVPGFDFLCTSFPETVGTICCIRQNYPDVLGLYAKSENLLEADKMQRIYQSIGTKLFKQNNRYITYHDYMVTPYEGVPPIFYSHQVYEQYFENNIARRVSNNLSNIGRFNQAILNLKANRGLSSDVPAASSSNNNVVSGDLNEFDVNTPSTSHHIPGVNQHIPADVQGAPPEITSHRPVMTATQQDSFRPEYLRKNQKS